MSLRVELLHEPRFERTRAPRESRRKLGHVHLLPGKPNSAPRRVVDHACLWPSGNETGHAPQEGPGLDLVNKTSPDCNQSCVTWEKDGLTVCLRDTRLNECPLLLEE